MMIFRIFLLILATLIILSMAGYAFYLFRKIRQQKNFVHNAQKARRLGLIESIEIIAKAIQSEQCDLSEGVIRLKYLLEALGHYRLSHYPAMWALFEVVGEMPILHGRKNLKRNERMKLDLVRENAEAEYETAIRQEIPQLLTDIEQFKKDI